ncbi:MAG: PIN domain nuclease [Thermoprotei archaeon]|nr:MAG: PIN domain nuclease [Thermoprotei archaeon]
MEKKIVVDASVIAKWYLIEEYSNNAIKLRNDYVRGLIQILVPSLLEYEVLNALRYSGVYNSDELKKIGTSINKYGFMTYDLDNDIKDLAIELAFRENITIYDASYIALAIKFNIPLYTADQELVSKFPSIAYHIKDYG